MVASGVSLAMLLAALTSTACGRSPLTREAAAELLSTNVLTGVEKLQFVTPRGCLTVPVSTPIEQVHLRGEPTVFARGDALRRELDLELVDIEFSEAPMTASTPLEGCDEAWIAHRADAAALKMIAWKAMPSDKALVAGLQSGQTFLYRRQTLADVDEVVTAGDAATVRYRWRWAPTEEGRHLGIRSGEPIPAMASFTRSGNRWKPAGR